MPSATLRPMPKRPSKAPTASDLTVRERVLLFCVASRTDWQRAGVPEETVTRMTVTLSCLIRLGGLLLRRAGVRCSGRCCRSCEEGAGQPAVRQAALCTGAYGQSVKTRSRLTPMRHLFGGLSDEGLTVPVTAKTSLQPGVAPGAPISRQQSVRRHRGRA